LHWSRGHDALLASPSDLNGEDGCQYGSVENLGRLADQFPDLKFVIFHAGYSVSKGPAPSEPALEFEHVRLAKLTRTHPNLYVEIGAIFSGLVLRFHVPRELREFISVLKSEAREDSVLWGTDAIWYGSPQWQIEAFKRLRLSDNPQPSNDEIAFKTRVLRSNALALFGAARL
jgi:hypothetical protein